jgi:uncharacterized protein YkwD
MKHSKLFNAKLITAFAALLVALAAWTPASAQAGCKHSGQSIKKISKKNARSAIGCLFNKKRSARNVKRDGSLEKAAQGHSSVMAAKNCYSHQCPGEPNLRDRIARTGYMRGSSNYGLGEVIMIANARASARQIVGAWMNSSGHASNIKNSGWEHTGIGLSIKRGAVYATADFGRR